MGVFAGPKVNSSNLSLSLDAGNAKSYSGSGTSWNNLISSPNFTLKNCSFNGSEIVGNGTTASIQSNSNLSLSTYSNLSIVLGFKSSDYISESVLLSHGLFYYLPSSLVSNSHSSLSRTATGISTYSPVYTTQSAVSNSHTRLSEAATGISTYSPVYGVKTVVSNSHSSLSRTATGISTYSPVYGVKTVVSNSHSSINEPATRVSSFNTLQNNSIILKLKSGSIVSDTIVSNNSVYSISTSSVNSNYNLISLVYSNLNTTNPTLSMYETNTLVGFVSLGTTSISFSDLRMSLLSIGGIDKLSNSSLKYLQIYNKNLSSSEILGIKAALGSRI